jgi:hypothetical protein
MALPVALYFYLELEPRSELHVPRVAHCGVHLPELCVSQECIRQTESRSVGEVEELCPNLELHILAN